MEMTHKKAKLGIRGVAHAKIVIPTAELDKLIITGMTTNPTGIGEVGVSIVDNGDGTTTVEGYRGNAFVNQGLHSVLDSAYGDLIADRITHIGVSGDTTTVTAATTDLDPLAAGSSIKVTANTVRTNQTVATDQTWTQADVSFAITKIGLLTGAASTDVVNIIGGTGGTAPYNEPFTIDLTNISTWTLTMGIDVTATAS